MASAADGCDTLWTSAPTLSHSTSAADQSALFAAALGMVVTSIFLLGMLERRNRTVLRMGYDSAGVLTTYGAGIVALYFLR